MDYTVLNSANLEMQTELQQYDMKNRMDVNKAIAMEYALNEAKLDFVQKKMRTYEFWKEARKASYVNVYIGAEGELEAETKSALVQLPKRKVANFNFAGIAYLQSDKGADGIFWLNIRIGNDEKTIFLKENKVGNLDYFMKKIVAVGGKFFANKEKEKKDLLAALWAGLCIRCESVIIVPEKKGWYRDEIGNYKFAEESDMLWLDVLEKAK